jgi:arylformamidase
MAILDITPPITPALPVYPGDPPPRIERISDLDRGDTATLSTLAATLHLGAHVDAPCHFLPNGAGVEALDRDALFGDAWVIDASAERRHLGRASLAQLGVSPGEERVLLNTAGLEALGRPHPAAEWLIILPDGTA